MLILDLKPFRSKLIKRKYSLDREFRGKKLFT